MKPSSVASPGLHVSTMYSHTHTPELVCRKLPLITPYFHSSHLFTRKTLVPLQLSRLLHKIQCLLLVHPTAVNFQKMHLGSAVYMTHESRIVHMHAYMCVPICRDAQAHKLYLLFYTVSSWPRSYQNSFFAISLSGVSINSQIPPVVLAFFKKALGTELKQTLNTTQCFVASCPNAQLFKIFTQVHSRVCAALKQCPGIFPITKKADKKQRLLNLNASAASKKCKYRISIKPWKLHRNGVATNQFDAIVTSNVPKQLL